MAIPSKVFPIKPTLTFYSKLIAADKDAGHWPIQGQMGSLSVGYRHSLSRESADFFRVGTCSTGSMKRLLSDVTDHIGIPGLNNPANFLGSDETRDVLADTAYGLYGQLMQDGATEQMRLLDGMIIEDVTNGTFYTVGDIGRWHDFPGFQTVPLGGPVVDSGHEHNVTYGLGQPGIARAQDLKFITQGALDWDDAYQSRDAKHVKRSIVNGSLCVSGGQNATNALWFFGLHDANPNPVAKVWGPESNWNNPGNEFFKVLGDLSVDPAVPSTWFLGRDMDMPQDRPPVIGVQYKTPFNQPPLTVWFYGQYALAADYTAPLEAPSTIIQEPDLKNLKPEHFLVRRPERINR